MKNAVKNSFPSRRTMLTTLGAGLGVGLFPSQLFAGAVAKTKGVVVGETTAAKIAEQVFADGGNVFDAVVAGGLAAAMTSPYQFGIGGYGGCATLALAGSKQIISIDFNTIAPTAAKPDMFVPEKGKPSTINAVGWLATGVPGVLAGLQHLLDKFGTRKFAELVQPAISLARDGVKVEGLLATLIARSATQFAVDVGSKKLYFQNDKPLKNGDSLKNPELADMLSTLAKRGSVESFYKGDIAQQIADGFKKNGGLVTAKDMAAFHVREVKPVSLAWGETMLYTAPPTAGGLTTLQALGTLKAMRWQQMPMGVARTQARIEALRLAWRDRLSLLGDPEMGKIPMERLLSEEYARESAATIEAALKSGKILTHNVEPRDQPGTINLSGADELGNFVALTLTHGDSLGACVTVDGLGLTLGQGMARFDIQPDHPNSPAPGKRPLHNMCPTIVTRDKLPILAIGGRGGRKIPNALFEALTEFVVLGRPLKEAIAAPRMHTEGTAALELEAKWPVEEAKSLSKFGYQITTARSAVLSAVVQDKTGTSTEMR